VLLESSAPEVMRSSEAPHQKQDHQKQFSSEAEDHQKLRELKLQKVVQMI